MVDQGLLDYKEKISKYWPEFGQNGKQSITLEELLRHEGGLIKFKDRINVEMTNRKNIKSNVLGKIIENEVVEQFRNTKRQYH